MDPAQLAFVDVKGGMDSSQPAHKIETNQVARMVNCALVDGYPTTRFGTRVIPISGDGAALFKVDNIQGSIFFNPGKGQGGILLGADNPRLAVAAGGRKYVVAIEGRHAASRAQLIDITGGLFTNPQLHLVCWDVWEDLLIAGDGQANTFIWDGTTSSFSLGYNTINKPASQIPNGAMPFAYVHGRGVAVVNSRWVLVGDVLHRSNQTTSQNLKEFTEQVYWATGQYFVPPSAMGGINAAKVLPLGNTNHGHGDLMLHCQDGVFSLDLSEFPRSKWSELKLVKHALLQSGAAGPYAIAIRDRDQIFRTHLGGKTLRSAVAESNLEGNPSQTITNAVDEAWLNGDYKRWLRFASVAVWDTGKRSLWTAGPIVQGRWRWHRGMVVRNLDPAESEARTPAAWEGLWTLPSETCGIIQFVGGIFDIEERMFAWTRGVDLQNRLVEFDTTLREDVLADGTHRPIRAQVITRAIDGAKWWEKREYTLARLYLRNIIGEVKWGVWTRSGESPSWIFFRAGTVTVPEMGPDDFDIEENAPRTVPIPLGAIPQKCVEFSKTNESRSIQFLVRWQGYCQFEGVRVTHGDTDLSQGGFDPSKLNITFSRSAGEDYDDFEYSSSEAALWISEDAA